MVVLVVELVDYLTELVEWADVSVFVHEGVGGDLCEFRVGLEAREHKGVFAERGGNCGIGGFAKALRDGLVEGAESLADECAAGGCGEH